MTAAKPPTAGITTLLAAFPLLCAAADEVLVVDLVAEAVVPVADAVEPEAVFATVAETLEPEAVGVVVRVDEVVP